MRRKGNSRATRAELEKQRVEQQALLAQAKTEIETGSWQRESKQAKELAAELINNVTEEQIAQAEAVLAALREKAGVEEPLVPITTLPGEDGKYTIVFCRVPRFRILAVIGQEGDVRLIVEKNLIAAKRRSDEAGRELAAVKWWRHAESFRTELSRAPDYVLPQDWNEW